MSHSVGSGLPVHAISAFLLELHERSHGLGYRELQRFALERLRELVAFDAAAFATGSLQNGVPEPQDVFLDRLSPEFLESWRRNRHRDAIIIGAMKAPGSTRAHVADDVYEGQPEMLEHSYRFGIRHVLCTALTDPTSGLFWVLPLSRKDETKPFSEAERLLVELITPHITTASRNARLGQLRAATRTVDNHGQATALLNEHGLILEAEPTFPELIRRAWPDWKGPWVPRPVADNLVGWRAAPPASRGTIARLTFGRLVLRFDPLDDGVLLRVRQALAADSLSVREREIAEAFSTGETAREVAKRLGLATNTIRRHLGNVYDKLGISSKAELQRMLAD